MKVYFGILVSIPSPPLTYAARQRPTVIVYIYIYIYIPTYMYVYICMCIYIYIHTYMYICIYMTWRGRDWQRLDARASHLRDRQPQAVPGRGGQSIYVYIYIYIYTHTCIYTHVHICIYVYIEREREILYHGLYIYLSIILCGKRHAPRECLGHHRKGTPGTGDVY